MFFPINQNVTDILLTKRDCSKTVKDFCSRTLFSKGHLRLKARYEILSFFSIPKWSASKFFFKKMSISLLFHSTGWFYRSNLIRFWACFLNPAFAHSDSLSTTRWCLLWDITGLNATLFHNVFFHHFYSTFIVESCAVWLLVCMVFSRGGIFRWEDEFTNLRDLKTEEDWMKLHEVTLADLRRLMQLCTDREATRKRGWEDAKDNPYRMQVFVF